MKTENQSSSINLFLLAILLVFFELPFSYPSEKKKVLKGYKQKNIIFTSCLYKYDSQFIVGIGPPLSNDFYSHYPHNTLQVFASQGNKYYRTIVKCLF